MKRIGIPMLALIAAFGIFLVSSALPTRAAELFPDVKAPLLREAVLDLAERGVLKGYEDGSFQPERIINRAEALKISFASREEEEEKSSINQSVHLDFSDVTEQDWFYPYLQSAVQENIVRGYEDGTYKPFQEVTRAEFLKIALLAEPEYLMPDLPPQSKTAAEISDVRENDWFLPFVSFVYENELMELESVFQPGQGMTRGEASLLLYAIDQWKTSRKIAWKEEFNSSGCDMCVHGIDFSQYDWAHWDMVTIAKSKISIGSRTGLADRFSRGEISVEYLADLAFSQQLSWRLNNTPRETKLRFDQDFPDYYRRGTGMNGGRTKARVLVYMSGNETTDPIRTVDGYPLKSTEVDTRFEKHLREIFSSGIKANPNKLDFKVWKFTDEGKEGMYNALLKTQWLDHLQTL